MFLTFALWALAEAAARHGRPEEASSSLQTSRSMTELTQRYPYYHTSDELLKEAQELVSKCAASLQTLRKQGVSMDVVRVNSTAALRNKVFILFGEHSRELIGPETGLALLKELCDEKSDVAQGARRDSEFMLVINGNPRSRRQVEGGDFCLRTNPSGVDLNRNWDEEWQQEASTFGQDSNPGPRPFSEPETQIFRELVSDYKPTTYLSVHSGTLGLYMPWAFDQKHMAHRNQKAMMGILKDLDASHCNCPYGAAGKEVGYSCPGTSLDWIYDKLKTPYAFAFEIFVGGGQMSLLKERWQAHRGASLLETHLAEAAPQFFKAHPSDFVQVAENSSLSDCFELYNPSTEDDFHRTVENWVKAYLEMAQEVAKLEASKGSK